MFCRNILFEKVQKKMGSYNAQITVHSSHRKWKFKRIALWNVSQCLYSTHFSMCRRSCGYTIKNKGYFLHQCRVPWRNFNPHGTIPFQIVLLEFFNTIFRMFFTPRTYCSFKNCSLKGSLRKSYFVTSTKCTIHTVCLLYTVCILQKQYYSNMLF